MSCFIFFGSSPISVTALDHLKANGLIPSLVVTKPDSPQGRGLQLKPSIVKEWCLRESVPVITPEKIKTEDFLDTLKQQEAEFAILVSYGKIIPQTIIDLFPKGIINVHPSLLPKLRGPAPIEFTILEDMKDSAGVSIMLLDSQMDHGPILASKQVTLSDWPVSKSTLYQTLSEEGAKLLTQVLPEYLNNNITPVAQEENEATYCKTISKQDGEITLEDDGYKNFLKFKAFEGWPGTFFFFPHENKNIRLKITEADYTNGQFKIIKVIPEGKKEMTFESFKNGLK